MRTIGNGIKAVNRYNLADRIAVISIIIRTTSEQAQQLAGGHELQLLLEPAVIFSR